MQRIQGPAHIARALLVTIGWTLGAIADQQPSPKAPSKPEGKSPVPSKSDGAANRSAESTPGNAKPAGAATAGTPMVDQSSTEESAIRSLAESLMRAYQSHDAQAFAAVFTEEGEFVDDTESLFHGREAISKEFAVFFKAYPESAINVVFDGNRPIAPGVVKVQGTTSFRSNPKAQAITGQCSLVCTKAGDQWQIASLREIATIPQQTRHDHVSQVQWLVGDWINEGQLAEIHFSCRWDESGNYLLRDFSIQAGERKVISGTQRIGYDPVSGHLKVWTFDSDGGYSDGYLRREDSNWMLHSSGVTDEGHMASGTEIFAEIQSNRIAWDCVDRIIAGKRIADTGKIVVVKKPPTPATAGVPTPLRQPKSAGK